MLLRLFWAPPNAKSWTLKYRIVSVPDQPEFWKEQAMIVDRLTAKIAEDGERVLTQPLLRQLRGVSAPIGQLAASATPDRPCAEIRRIAEQLAAQ
jgi:hypothetical protein